MRVLADALDFPEGPAFDADGILWCVELNGSNLVQILDSGLKRIATSGAPNGIAVDARGRIWFCDSMQNAIRRYDPATAVIETIIDKIDGEQLAKPNDLVFDPVGNLIFTCPGESRKKATGYVCCLQPNGRITRVVDGLFFPNGLAFSPDGKYLIIAETYRQRLWKGHWQWELLQWENPSPFFDTGGIVGPDGMAFSRNGTLYVAVYGSGSVKSLDMAGTAQGTITTPGANPTNVALSMDGHLIVTEAENGQILEYQEIGEFYPAFDGGDTWGD